jgi:hypothetical protein
MMTNVYYSASYLLYEEGREMIIRPHKRLSYYYSLSPNSGIICLEAHPCLPAEKCHWRTVGGLIHRPAPIECPTTKGYFIAKYI